MSDWMETLPSLRDRCWARWAQAAEQADVISLATVSPAGAPEVRSVVLRLADSDKGVLEVYTDLQSDKISSLRARPQVELMLWDADLKLQMRAQADVTILQGGPVMDRWAAVPDHSRLSYGVTPAPGQVITESTAYTKAPDPQVFAVLQCQVTRLDAVHLGRPHRRARFLSQGGEDAAAWLAP